MKVKFLVPMFYQGQNFEKGKVYEVEDESLKAMDPADYEEVGDDEEAEPKAKKNKASSKGAPKEADNK